MVSLLSIWIDWSKSHLIAFCVQFLVHQMKRKNKTWKMFHFSAFAVALEIALVFFFVEEWAENGRKIGTYTNLCYSKVYIYSENGVKWLLQYSTDPWPFLPRVSYCCAQNISIWNWVLCGAARFHHVMHTCVVRQHIKGRNISRVSYKFNDLLLVFHVRRLHGAGAGCTTFTFSLTIFVCCSFAI